MTADPHPVRRGRPVDAEIRRLALELREEIEASPYSKTDVTRLAGYTDASSYNHALVVLRGTKASRPVVRRLRAAFNRLVVSPPSPDAETGETR